MDGAAREIRTPDPLITNEVLYQLSYCGAATASGRRPGIGEAVYANLPGFGNMSLEGRQHLGSGGKFA